MFGFWTKKQAKPQPASLPPVVSRKATMSPSVIASNMNVLGNIISEGILDIDGQVDGNVRGHSVTVRPNGRICGDLIAEDVFIYGEVDGLIKARNVTLYATAHVTGTVMHESVTIEDGASIDGKLKRSEQLLLPGGARILDSSTSHATPEKPSENADLRQPSLMDSMFDNDNEDPQSEAEMRVLENLRLIS